MQTAGFKARVVRSAHAGAVLLLLLLLGAAVPRAQPQGAAAPPPTVKLVLGSWCPFSCTAEQAGGLQGFVTDIATAVFSRHGVQVSFVGAAYARGLELVRKNQAQGILATIQADAPDLIFPQVEQGLTGNTFFVRAGDAWRYTGLQSLSELRKIGTIQGADYVELDAVIAREPQRFEAISGVNAAWRSIQKLLAGRIDAIVQDAAVIEFELKLQGKSGALVPAGSLRDVLKVYLAFSPRLPEAQQYAEWMSRGTEELRASGELARILANYGLRDWAAAARAAPPQRRPAR